jgi:type II secretory pathway pseudopilin PulG
MNKIFKNKKINLNNERGFTIMETLVAIFILLISITGPMVFSQNGLRAAFQSRDQVTAFYLAQDAVEYVKNMRDHNILSSGSANWLDGLSDCIADDPADYGCTLDASLDVSGGDSPITDCTSPGSDPGCLGENDDGSEDNKLRVNPTTGLFSTDPSDNESEFARNIYIRPMPGTSNEVEIIVKVRWTSHDTIGVRDITVVEYMYNWAGELGL